MQAQIKQTLATIRNLPTLPAVIGRLREAVADDGCTAAKLAKIIEDDPAIMARVLKVVNSVLYSTATGRPVDHVLPAVVRLGFETIKNVTLSTAVFDTFGPSKNEVFDRKEFWRHCVTVGIVAEALYGFCGDAIGQRLPKDLIHLSGLLHDVGKLVLEVHFPDAFHRLIEVARQKNVSLHVAEVENLGVDHAEIGAWLCARWGIDQRIATVVQHHHDPTALPDGEEKALATLVHLADYISLVRGLGQSGNPLATHRGTVRKALGLEMKNISELMDLVEVEAQKSYILLSLQ